LRRLLQTQEAEIALVCYLRVARRVILASYRSRLEPRGTFGRDLSQPFQITTATDALAHEDLERLGDRDEYPGILKFCHHGRAIYSYLVVNGPSYGTIWDVREEFHPRAGIRGLVWALA
jgi:hypothetical protein